MGANPGGLSTITESLGIDANRSSSLDQTLLDAFEPKNSHWYNRLMDPGPAIRAMQVKSTMHDAHTLMLESFAKEVPVSDGKGGYYYSLDNRDSVKTGQLEGVGVQQAQALQYALFHALLTQRSGNTNSSNKMHEALRGFVKAPQAVSALTSLADAGQKAGLAVHNAIGHTDLSRALLDATIHETRALIRLPEIQAANADPLLDKKLKDMAPPEESQMNLGPAGIEKTGGELTWEARDAAQIPVRKPEVLGGSGNTASGITASEHNDLPETRNQSVDNSDFLPAELDGKVEEVATETLSNFLVEAFRDGHYRTFRTLEQITVYRKFGRAPNSEQAAANGHWAAPKPNGSRQSLAVGKQWNTMQYVAEIQIPQGQKINVGKVAGQPLNTQPPKYRGLGDQILLPFAYPVDWIQKVIDLKSGQEYTLDEFRRLHPNQFRGIVN